MQRVVAPLIGVIVDGYAWLHMVACPSESSVAATNIIRDPIHAWQHRSGAVGVGNVLAGADRWRRYDARDGHLDQGVFIGFQTGHRQRDLCGHGRQKRGNVLV